MKSVGVLLELVGVPVELVGVPVELVVTSGVSRCAGGNWVCRVSVKF